MAARRAQLDVGSADAFSVVDAGSDDRALGLLADHGVVGHAPE